MRRAERRCAAKRRGIRRTFAAGATATLVVSMMVIGVAQTTGEPAGPNDSEPTNPPETHGDLSHLVYTAQTGLVAHIISPDDGGVVNTLATSFEVATVAGAGVEIAIDGQVVPVKRLGRRVEFADGTVRYTYYGIALAPGPNTVVATPLGAGGLRGPSVTERVWGPGTPEAIHLGACTAPHADGRTPCPVHVAVLDHWGHPAAPGTTLRVAIASGDAVIVPTGISGGDVVGDLNAPPATPNAAPGRRSVSVVLAAGGYVTLPIVPGIIPGRIEIAAGTGELSASTALDAMAFGRPPFVTGLATVGFGAVPGDPGADPTAADGTNSRRGRVALYGTGSLFGNAVGSIAYDTAGSLAATPSSGTFNDDPEARPYATYGDASVRRNDALTQDRLYARIDDGYDSALWGEFQATTGPPGTAGAVAMQVDGAKVVVGSAKTTLSGFTAANQIGYGREVLLPTGLATLETLAHDNLIVGSETVTLVSLDRRTGVILRQTTLENVVDYTIDYAGGTIHFINVPLPYDAGFNPQEILVTYEYSAVGGAAKTTGLRFDSSLGRFDALKVGLGYLNDATGTGNFALLAQNLSGALPGGGWSVSRAQSAGFVPGSGNGFTAAEGSGSAFRFSGTGTLGLYKFNAGYDTTSAGYNNPFGDLNTPGVTDYHATLLRSFGAAHGDLSLAYDRESNDAPGGAASTESNLAAILREKFGPQVTVRAGITFHNSATAAAAAAAQTEPATTIASVTQADLGIDWKAARNVTLSVEREQTVGGFDATQPAQTTAQISWDISNRGRIFARELLEDAPPRVFDSTADIASATRDFELGITQNIDANTAVESSYDVSRTGNGTDITSEIGVKEHVIVSKLLKGDAFVQRGSGSGDAIAHFLVYGLSLGYADPAGRLRATGSLQNRTGADGGMTWSLGAAGRIFGDFSLVAADRGSRTQGSVTDDTRVAIAWRPSLSDRGALLAGYERSAGNAGVAGAQSGVLSLDGQYRPTRRFEMTGRFARKIDGDSNYLAGTSLVGLGVRQQIGARFDLGVETRAILAQSAEGGLHSTAVEMGSMLGDTLRAALGYNFGATADPTFAAAPVRKGFYATLTTTIDRIFGWGAH